MPLGTSFRRSVPYLYLKAYTLSTLVSIFASTPISRRIPIERLKRWEQLRKRGEERIKLAKLGLTESEIGKRFIDFKKENQVKIGNNVWKKIAHQESYEKSELDSNLSKALKSNGSRIDDFRYLKVAEKINREKDTLLPLPFSALSNHPSSSSPSTSTLQLDSPSTESSKASSPLLENLPKYTIYDILKRWYRRANELSEIRKLMKRDDQDEKTFPEIKWDAKVRRSHSLHPSEISFLKSRKAKILDSGSFASFLQLSTSEAEKLDVRDIPIIAIGGSGGGYRAMIGFTAFLETFQKCGAFEIVSYISGVSGSCWTISSLYTIATLLPSKLLSHYGKVASENLHPMSRSALDVVARTKKGSYFLLAPLLRKAGSGIVGLGIMDLYATILNSYQLLSRDPHPPARLSRATFQWSKVWERAGLDSGNAPLPILTAVRVVHPEKERKKKIKSRKSEEIESRMSKQSSVGSDSGESIPETIQSENDALLTEPSKPASKFHWYEISPLEFGSVETGAWIPTWAFGRSFRSGKSLSRSPETSLALILGMVTSAPAGPLTGYVSALLATLPTNTIMSNFLSKVNDIVKMRRWERRWGNPIRAADEPNPFYGLKCSGAVDEESDIAKTEVSTLLPTSLSNSSSTDSRENSGIEKTSLEWEATGRIKLMDAGLSNNSPSHVLYNQVRKADIIVNFDASSDVQSGSGLERMFDFGKERGLSLALSTKDSPTFDNSQDDVVSSKDLRRLSGQHAVRLNGWDRRKKVTGEQTPDLRMLYCPLLPNQIQPEFNPATAPWCTSYNLIWKPEEVDILARTASSNAEIVVKELKDLVREVWQAKRKERMMNEMREVE